MHRVSSSLGKPPLRPRPVHAPMVPQVSFSSRHAPCRTPPAPAALTPPVSFRSTRPEIHAMASSRFNEHEDKEPQRESVFSHLIEHINVQVPKISLPEALGKLQEETERCDGIDAEERKCSSSGFPEQIS